MKPILIISCCILCIVAAVSLVHSMNSASTSEALRRQLKTQTAESQARFDALTEIESNDSQTIITQQNNISKMRNTISNLDVEMTVTKSRLSQYVADEFYRTNKEAAYNALVPRPNGNTFPKLVGKQGGTLMENASFVQVYGRRLLFRNQENGGAPKTFDVDDLHPAILKYLGIDSESAKVAAKNMGEAYQRQWQATSAQILLNQQQAAIQAQADAKIRADNAVAQAEIQAKQAAAETERIKAQAAMIEAQKPPNQINIIQQQQSQQRIGY